MTLREKDIRWLERKLRQHRDFKFTKQKRVFYRLLMEREELKKEIEKMRPLYIKKTLNDLVRSIDGESLPASPANGGEE